MMGTMGAKTVFGESTHLYEKRQVSVCLCVCFSQNVKTNLEDSFSTHLLGQAKCVHSFDKKAKVTPSLEPFLSIWSTTVQIPV